jgi:hypothetical protein
MRRQRFQAYGMQVMNNPILGEGSHKFSWYKFSHLEDQPKKVEVIILVGVEKLSVAPPYFQTECCLLACPTSNYCDDNHLINSTGSAILHECGCRILLGFLNPLLVVVIKIALSLPNLCNSLIIAAWSVILI